MSVVNTDAAYLGFLSLKHGGTFEKKSSEKCNETAKYQK